MVLAQPLGAALCGEGLGHTSHKPMGGSFSDALTLRNLPISWAAVHNPARVSLLTACDKMLTCRIRAPDKPLAIT